MKKFKLIINNEKVIYFTYFTQKIKDICGEEKWDLFKLNNKNEYVKSNEIYKHI